MAALGGVHHADVSGDAVDRDCLHAFRPVQPPGRLCRLPHLLPLGPLDRRMDGGPEVRSARHAPRRRGAGRGQASFLLRHHPAVQRPAAGPVHHEKGTEMGPDPGLVRAAPGLRAGGSRQAGAGDCRHDEGGSGRTARPRPADHLSRRHAHGPRCAPCLQGRVRRPLCPAWAKLRACRHQCGGVLAAPWLLSQAGPCCGGISARHHAWPYKPRIHGGTGAAH